VSGAAPSISAGLVCPACHGSLRGHAADGDAAASVRCEGCGRAFPLVGDVPVLLLDDSAFDPAAVAAGADAYFPDRGNEDRRIRNLRRRLPGLASDLQHEAVDELVRNLVAGRPGPPIGLVVGAGRRADDYRARFPGVELLVTDVEPALGAHVVADTLALPVADSSQDLVVAEHVIEHVVDPMAAGREIERVLRPGGIVLAKVPFSYPWHGGYVDFFRFTPAGFLAAFPATEPLHVGHGPGPMTSVAYTLQAAWVSLFSGRRARRIAVATSRICLGWLHRLDRFLIGRPGSLGATTTVVLVGRRVEHRRSARETVALARRLGSAPVLPPPAADHC
jgi:SAM-dependent methyltransferase/uncharacterized protein YbaR (Trm112 family)